MSAPLKVVFNPFTGNLTLAGNGKSIEDIIKSMLFATDETVDYPMASNMYDATSMLWNDDEAEL